MANKKTHSVRTRKDALSMQKWDPTLLWYAKAVGKMKTRAIKDVTSWGYQGAVHGFDQNATINGRQPWATIIGTQSLPSGTGKYWEQCQHSTWYFLPWHRLYLGYFEQIVRQTVADLGGPADWALPYWNYNNGASSRKLPDAFTEQNLPDGSPNPLREANRDHGNNGQPFLNALNLSLKPAFAETQFEASAGDPGFGGPVTAFRHTSGPFGALENQPHNQVHVEIGGLMSDPDTAALDPIFWLHHANIDRLWQAWIDLSNMNQNPSANNWLSFSFDFRNVAGKAVTGKAADILDTTKAPFYYKYDNTSVTTASAPKPKAAVTTGARGLRTMRATEPQPLPELVGSTTSPTTLADQTATHRLRLFPATGPQRMLGASGTHFRRAYLQLENVRGEGPAASYQVYLNVPEGQAEPPEELYVGTAATFGLRRASIPTARHPGGGLHFSFDVTDVVNKLKAKQEWHPDELRVTFVPVRKASADSAIEVGRISLYYH